MKQAILNRFRIFSLELTMFNRFKLFIFSCLSPFFKKIGVSLPVFKIKFGDSFIFIYDETDLGTFSEIFIFEEYKIPNLSYPIKRILDLGANSGYASIYFANLFGEAQIIAVEPDPRNVEKIKINTLKLGGRVIVEPSAVSSKSGFVDFYLNFNISISGSILSRDSKSEKITVSSLALSDLEKKYGPFDIIKFDIEGEEWDAISPEMLIREPKLWIGEYHEDLTKKPEKDFKARFSKYAANSRQISKKRFLMTFVNEFEAQ